MSWKKISSTKLFEHPRHSVYEDLVELPNGKQTTYLHFGDASDSATIIAIRHDGHILIQKEYSYPPDEWLFQFPGGAVDGDETPQKGALRELAEEASLGGALKQIGWFYTDNRRKSARMYVFVATDLVAATGIKDPEEVFEDYWFTKEQIGQMISKNDINNYATLAAWALFVNTKEYAYY